jgi:Holliday junction resolvasome RuvABC endonuclease subunit
VSQPRRKFRLGVDPGLTLGFALVEDSTSVPLRAGCVEAPREGTIGERIYDLLQRLLDSICDIPTPSIAYIEQPGFFPSAGGYRTAASGDLIKLTLSAGAVHGALAIVGVHNIRFVPPSEWKGQLPKRVVDKRLASHLKMKERLMKRHLPTSHERDALAMVLSMRGDLKL